MTLLNVLATPLCFVPNLLEGKDNYDVLFRLVTSYTAIHGVSLHLVSEVGCLFSEASSGTNQRQDMESLDMWWLK